MALLASVIVSQGATYAHYIVDIRDEQTLEKIKVCTGIVQDGTANAAYILGAAAAAQFADDNDQDITIISAGEYLILGATQWLENWKAKSWRNAAKKPVLNKEQWEVLDGFIQKARHKISFVLTKDYQNATGRVLPSVEEKAPIETAHVAKVAEQPVRKIQGVEAINIASEWTKGRLEIYTDGACSGNPGPGGYGVIVLNEHRQVRSRLSGSEKGSTNNRMELMAMITALEHIKAVNLPAKIYSDSKYVLDGINSWIAGWKKNGRLYSPTADVKNAELWQMIDTLTSDKDMPEIEYQWVKGHAGNQFNEMVDQLAVQAALRAR